MSYEKKTSNGDINEDHNYNCKIKQEEIHIKDEIAETNETNLEINFAVGESMEADIIRKIKEEVIQEFDSPDYIVCSSKFENGGNYADIKDINIIPDECGFNGTKVKLENEGRYNNVKRILYFPLKIYTINETPSKNNNTTAIKIRTKNKRRFREKKYQCNICQKLFAYPTSLKTHLVVHIGDSLRVKNKFTFKKRHQCRICLKIFPHKNSLNGHLVVHIGDKRKGKYHFLQKAKSSV